MTAEASARKQERWRSLDQTGNVRLLTSEDAGPEQDPADQAALAGGQLGHGTDQAISQGGAGSAGQAAAAKAAPAKPDATAAATGGTTVRLVPQPASAPAQESDPAPPAPAPEPMPGYDSWSLPSLRARLRSLNAAQVRALADYERSNAGRAEVLGMFERRLAKISGSG